LRRELAWGAFAHTAAYDAAIASWFAEGSGAEELPRRLVGALEKVTDLRYGENPHQRGALYALAGTPGPLGGGTAWGGKELSFNNWLDAEAALTLARALPGPAAVVVKHNNPCGAASAPSLEQAYRRAVECDPTSAFGGVVACNTPVDAATARAITEIFTEVVVAPDLEPGAREILDTKPSMRVILTPGPAGSGLDVRAIEGGALVQEPDAVTEGRDAMKVVSSREPTADEWEDLLFAWVVAARVKSNAIVLARGRATVGIGAGQMSRVDSVDIACRKAGDRARGAVMASDAFFPFRDGIDRAAKAGVTAVIQPGGSVRDQEVLDAADEHGMAVVLTGRRHFRH
ncbi:MAG: bifunctional phosphoribosylaminoimidazolecarboxamide formyltransferase/IMP cyclohydrolase, partial [Actinobacteria bacterium]|nr:bifunctional phosphoribosylaminoimidazolecarboxamide formyltransferase/IMP cyclohydrolase [Actinomycetota bacterium]